MRLLRICALYVVFFGIAGWVSYYLYNDIAFAHSIHGVVMGKTIEVDGHLPGFIKKIYFNEGQTVKKGDVLFALDDEAILVSIDNLEKLMEKKRNEIKAVEILIAEEIGRKAYYKFISRQREIVGENRIAAEKATLKYNKIQYKRLISLIPTGGVATQTAQLQKSLTEANFASLKGQEANLILQKFITKETNNGRFFAGSGVGGGLIQGNKKKYDLVLTEKESELQLLKKQLAEANLSLKRTKVFATRNGHIYTLQKIDGDYVNPGDMIMSIVVKDQPWIVARFKFDEALKISLGEEAIVYIPCLDRVARGKVVAIGHSGLSQVGIVSADLELSLSEVPVKIVLNNVDEYLPPGVRVEVKIVE